MRTKDNLYSLEGLVEVSMTKGLETYIVKNEHNPSRVSKLLGKKRTVNFSFNGAKFHSREGLQYELSLGKNNLREGIKNLDFTRSKGGRYFSKSTINLTYSSGHKVSILGTLPEAKKLYKEIQKKISFVSTPKKKTVKK